MKRYRKAIIAAAGFLLVLGKVLADGSVSADELGALAVAGGVALGVYQIPNEAA